MTPLPKPTNWAPSGMVASRVTSCAVWCPLLVMVQVYVTCSPVSTVLGAPTVTRARSACGPDALTTLVAWLFVPSGSGALLVAVAVTVFAPAELAVAVTAYEALPPEARLPALQLTVRFGESYEQEPSAEPKSSPLGSCRCAAAFAAGLGPSLCRPS